MKVINYTIRAPFMCRVGQFEKDKQTLVVGLREAMVKQDAVMHLVIGKKTYVALNEDLRKLPHTVWNTRDRFSIPIWIMPLSYFKPLEE